MTHRSALGELAALVARSPLAAADPATRLAALDGLARAGVPRHARRTVAELLAAVLALSARTRRQGQRRALVELDVFKPDGKRAVTLRIGAEPMMKSARS